MCIQFVYINNDAPDGEWQVIIANNRDELYTRPTKPAGPWDDNINCISGIDLEPGREGGTWIGINSANGKCGSLLNILTNSQQTKNKAGRGNLVTDFLRNTQTAKEYLSTIEDHAKSYNPFNLVLMEYSSGKWKTTYYSNADDNTSEEIQEERYGFGNSVYYQPWQKLLAGKKTFNGIVDKYKRTDQLDSLQKEVITLLNDPVSHLPDPVLEAQGEGYLNQELLAQRSGIYVDSRQIKYGTRTNTLILIDSSGNGKYIERTMIEPVDPEKPEWSTKTIPIKIQTYDVGSSL